MTRKYTLRRRAELQADTRDRIVQAAIELHARGPASISAIAAHAGVGRMTVYRHFPDEGSLITACTSVVFAATPLPAAGEWQSIANPAERLRVALDALYAYYADMEALLASAAANRAAHPALREAFAPFEATLEEMGDVLSQGWDVESGPGTLMAGAIGHALAFGTWQSLSREQGLTRQQAIALMVSLVSTTAAQAQRMVGETAGER